RAGALIGPEPFCEVEGGFSDGLCLDAEGNVWVAATFAANVQAFDRAGKPVERLDCGEGALVTSCCFGGPDGRTLFVTTLGRVLAFAVGVAGLPLFPFR